MKKNKNSSEEDGGYSQVETLETLARRGNIEAIKMLQELEHKEALDHIVEEKFGVTNQKGGTP